MKITKQKNTFLLLGAALVIGLVALGASNEVPSTGAEPADASVKPVVPMDQQLLEELQKTNRILIKMAEIDPAEYELRADDCECVGRNEK
ncbi:MAG: hypothetical protein JXR40_08285 [Pontiellaceae bacterium]|nr:hypothetical protein [Pontiellaceae bacterium]